MLASALLRHGPKLLGELTDGLSGWLAEHDYSSVEQLKGSMSQETCGNPRAFERSQYVRALVDYQTGRAWRSSQPRSIEWVAMTSYTQTVSRRLPRGWLHLLAQLGFWLGFYVVYQLARGFADRNVSYRVLERDPRDPDRGLVGHAVRAHSAAGRRLVVDPDHGDHVHLLALPVRRRRPHAALGLFQASRAVRRLPELADRSEPGRPIVLRRRSDGAAATVPGVGVRRHAGPALRASTTSPGSSLSLRTRTRRCRACTRWMRSSSAS